MSMISTMKAELKAQAATIKAQRSNYKEACRGHAHSAVTPMWQLVLMSRDYRHKHIAYCELRGVPRDRIEKPREGNAPDEAAIARYKTAYAEPAKAEQA